MDGYTTPPPMSPAVQTPPPLVRGRNLPPQQSDSSPVGIRTRLEYPDPGSPGGYTPVLAQAVCKLFD